MKPTVFFDMDGVLADFVQGVLSHHGRLDFPMKDVRWGIEAQLGIEPTKFWEGLGYNFWANLTPLQDGMKLLQETEWMVGPRNVGLLTSPCDTSGCYEGKKAWVRKHLDDYSTRLFTGIAKHMFAGPGKILVDDNNQNCHGFAFQDGVPTGGVSIVIPRPWNHRIAEVDESGHFQYAGPLAEIRSQVTLCSLTHRMSA